MSLLRFNRTPPEAAAAAAAATTPTPLPPAAAAAAAAATEAESARLEAAGKLEAARLKAETEKAARLKAEVEEAARLKAEAEAEAEEARLKAEAEEEARLKAAAAAEVARRAAIESEANDTMEKWAREVFMIRNPLPHNKRAEVQRVLAAMEAWICDGWVHPSEREKGDNADKFKLEGAVASTRVLAWFKRFPYLVVAHIDRSLEAAAHIPSMFEASEGQEADDPADVKEFNEKLSQARINITSWYSPARHASFIAFAQQQAFPSEIVDVAKAGAIVIGGWPYHIQDSNAAAAAAAAAPAAAASSSSSSS
jgi:flagellar biosynthesis GTPase FlhF